MDTQVQLQQMGYKGREHLNRSNSCLHLFIHARCLYRARGQYSYCKLLKRPHDKRYEKWKDKSKRFKSKLYTMLCNLRRASLELEHII